MFTDDPDKWRKYLENMTEEEKQRAMLTGSSFANPYGSGTDVFGLTQAANGSYFTTDPSLRTVSSNPSNIFSYDPELALANTYYDPNSQPSSAYFNVSGGPIITTPDTGAAAAGKATGGASDMGELGNVREATWWDKTKAFGENLLEKAKDNAGAITGLVVGGPLGLPVGKVFDITGLTKKGIDWVSDKASDVLGGKDRREAANAESRAKVAEDAVQNVYKDITGYNTPLSDVPNNSLTNQTYTGDFNWMDKSNLSGGPGDMNIGQNVIVGSQTPGEQQTANTVSAYGLTNPYAPEAGGSTGPTNTIIPATNIITESAKAPYTSGPPINTENINAPNTSVFTPKTGLPEGYVSATDRSVSTKNAMVDPGSLPQFRNQMNRTLGELKNAAIMRGTPLTQNELSGVVEGFASGASGRMNAANELALQNRQMESVEQQFNQQMAENQRQFDNGQISDFEKQTRDQELEKWKTEQANALEERRLALEDTQAKDKLQLLRDQFETSKEQWEKGFLNDKEYNDKVLALEEEFARLGYNLDIGQIKNAEKNQDWGNAIGLISLIDELWG